MDEKVTNFQRNKTSFIIGIMSTILFIFNLLEVGDIIVNENFVPYSPIIFITLIGFAYLIYTALIKKRNLNKLTIILLVFLLLIFIFPKVILLVDIIYQKIFTGQALECEEKLNSICSNKPSDYVINPIQYDECKNFISQIEGMGINKCGDIPKEMAKK
jgi:hypothetical protein